MAQGAGRRRVGAVALAMVMAGGLASTATAVPAGPATRAEAYSPVATPLLVGPGDPTKVTGALPTKVARKVVLQVSSNTGPWSRAASGTSTRRGRYRFDTVAPSEFGFANWRVKAPRTRMRTSDGTRVLRTFRSPAISTTVEPEPWLATAAPVISGVAKVGSVLTVGLPGWSPQPASVSYQWWVDGTPIADATGTEYTVVAADQDLPITVSVWASRPGHADVHVTSEAVTVAPEPVFEWQDVTVLTDALLQGSASAGTLTIRTNVTSGLGFRVTGPLDGLLELDPDEAVRAGEEFVVPYTVTAPGAAGAHAGTVVAIVDGVEIGQPLPYAVDVTALDAGTVPLGTSAPAPGRVERADGLALVRDRITVRLRADVADPRAEITNLALQVDALVEGSVGGTGIFDLRVPAERVDEVLTMLRSDPAVDLAMLGLLGSADVVPEDPIWTAPDDGGRWNLEMIDAPDAWEGATGVGVPVGVIDTGFALEHPDLAPNVLEHAGSGDDPTHGSHTAGTACAAGDNGVGLTGVAFSCDLVLRSIMSETSASQMVEAMRWTARQGARVVNISYGYSVDFDCTSTSLSADQVTVLRALSDVGALLRKEAARLDDVLWVFSAGNEARDATCSAAGHLADQPNAVTVAAVGRTGELASYSNYGPAVSVAAPGGAPDGEIYSAAPRICFLLDGATCTPEYAYMRGTSMAAPHVTGTAALAFQAGPDLRPAQVKQCLLSAAEAGGRSVAGEDFYVIDAARTVDCASAASPDLMSDPVLQGWGSGPGGYGGSGSPMGVPEVDPLDMSLHGEAVAVADHDGRLWTWGSNSMYLLGNGSSSHSPEVDPVRLVSPRGVVDVEHVQYVGLALDDAGHVHSWGTDSYGLLGLGRLNGNALSPTRIPSLDDVVQIEVGAFNASVLTADGRVYTWGEGAYGSITTTPKLVEGLPRVSKIFTARHVTFGIDREGRLWSWGALGRALGRGGGPAPGVVPGLSGVVDVVGTNIRTSESDVFALSDDGSVWGWGDGTYGLLGTGHRVASNVPVKVEGVGHVEDLAVGLFTAYAVDDGGVVRAWGYGFQGELGDGTTTWYAETPQVIPGLPSARSVHSTGSAQFVVDTQGGVWAWGLNATGTLGTGTYEDSLEPVNVPGLTEVSSIFVPDREIGVFATVRPPS